MAKKTAKIVVTKKIYLEIEASDALLDAGLSQDEAIKLDIDDLEQGIIDIEDLTWISWDEDVKKVKVKK